MLRIKVIGASVKAPFELKHGKYFVGSATNCQISVTGIPNRLFRLVYTKDAIEFAAMEDNKLLHNGEVADSGKLVTGDTIAHKYVTFVFEETSPAKAKVDDATAHIGSDDMKKIIEGEKKPPSDESDKTMFLGEHEMMARIAEASMAKEFGDNQPPPEPEQHQPPPSKPADVKKAPSKPAPPPEDDDMDSLDLPWAEEKKPDIDASTVYVSPPTPVDSDAATAYVGGAIAGGLPPALMAILQDKMKMMRSKISLDDIQNCVYDYDKAPIIPNAVFLDLLSKIKAAVESKTLNISPAPSEKEIKALLCLDSDFKDTVTAALSKTEARTSRDTFKVKQSEFSKKTEEVGKTGTSAPISKTISDTKSKTVSTIIDKEVKSTDKTKTMDDPKRTQTLLRVLENLGVKEETVRTRALALSEGQEGLTTGELLANLGLLTEEEIDVKPSKQLSGKKPQIEGKILGDYKLIKELGSGGFGVVYKGTSLVDNKIYAIKVLFKEYSDDITQLAIFARESKTAKQFDHKNILKVFGLERFRETYYIVSEFVDGGDISDAIKAKDRLGWEAVAHMGKQICDGLHYSAFPPGTLRGIVHRDIKPQNILLTKDGTPKIADFGLAKFEEGTSAETQVYETTDAMVFKGTVSYAAPERFSGGKDIDHRSDIYSLGVMFYEMATGKLPFKGHNVSELILAHINEKPLPPRMINPAIPPSLENLILKCLQKKPEQRYNNAGELAAEFEKMLSKKEATEAFSLGEAFKSWQFAATVSIPSTLPSDLPFNLRLKYFLMRPRPNFWRIVSAVSVVAILGIAAMIFVPILLNARAMSKANAFVTKFEYESAISVLRPMITGDKKNQEAMELWTRLNGKVQRLHELRPAIAAEQKKADPDPEKLFQMLDEAFGLVPLDFADAYVNAAIKAAKIRIARAEFIAADQLLRTSMNSIVNMMGGDGRIFLDSLKEFHEESSPETMASNYANLKTRIAGIEESLRPTDNLFIQQEGKRKVSPDKLDSILTSLRTIGAIYAEMVDRAPDDIEARLGKVTYSRLFDNFSQSVDAEKAGTEYRLPRLLSMMRVEPEIKELNLVAMLEIYNLWKSETPFEEVLDTAQVFGDPTDFEKTRLAIQLCQIVLSIVPDESRAMSILSEITKKLIAAISIDSPNRDLLIIARAAVTTELRYSPANGKANGIELIRTMTAILDKFIGLPEFIYTWNQFHPLLDLLRGVAGAPTYADAFTNYLGKNFIFLIRNARYYDAQPLLDSLFVLPETEPAAPAFAKDMHDGMATALPKGLSEACVFSSEFINAINAAKTPFANELSKSISELRTLRDSLVKLDEAKKIVFAPEPDDASINKAKGLIVEIEAMKVPYPAINNEISRLNRILANFDIYRLAIARRSAGFALLADGKYSEAQAAFEEVAGLIGEEAVEIGQAVMALSKYLSSEKNMAEKNYQAAVTDAVESVGASRLVEDALKDEKEISAWNGFDAQVTFQSQKAAAELARAQALQRAIESATAMMAEGDKIFDAGDYGAAIEMYQKSKATHPLPGIDDKISACARMTGFNDLLAKAKQAIDGGRYLDALELLNRAKEIRDTNEVAFLISRVEKLIVFSKNFADGKAAFNSGDFDKAISLLEIALQNAPNEKRAEVQSLLNLAYVRKYDRDGRKELEAGNFRAARDNFSKSFKYGNSAAAHAGYGIALLEITALPDVTREELINPEKQTSRVDEALGHLKTFRAAIADDNDENKKLREEWYVLVVRNESLALFYKYQALHDKKYLVQALTLIDEAIAAEPTKVDFHIDKAAIFYAMQRFNESYGLLMDGLRKAPDNALLLRHLGAVLMAMGKLEDSETYLKKAVQGNPSDAYAYLGLGNLYKIQDKLEEAEKVILEAVRVAPNLPEAHNNLAWLYATSTDPKFFKPQLALEHAVIANELTGYRNPDWLDTLAHAAAANGDFKKAIEVEKLALKIAPDREDLQKALEEFEKKAREN